MAGTTRPSPLPVTLPDGKVDQNIRDKWQLERQLVDVTRPYTSYIPTITGTSGGFAFGTGGFISGRWKRIGPVATVEIICSFGNPGFVPGGNTTWAISLPVTPFLQVLPVAWNNKSLGTCAMNAGIGQLQALHACLAHRVGIGGVVLKDFIIAVTGGNPGTLLTGTVPGFGQGAFMQVNLEYECLP